MSRESKSLFTISSRPRELKNAAARCASGETMALTVAPGEPASFALWHLRAPLSLFAQKQARAPLSPDGGWQFRQGRRLSSRLASSFLNSVIRNTLRFQSSFDLLVEKCAVVQLKYNRLLSYQDFETKLTRLLFRCKAKSRKTKTYVKNKIL